MVLLIVRCVQIEILLCLWDPQNSTWDWRRADLSSFRVPDRKWILLLGSTSSFLPCKTHQFWDRLSLWACSGERPPMVSGRFHPSFLVLLPCVSTAERLSTRGQGWHHGLRLRAFKTMRKSISSLLSDSVLFSGTQYYWSSRNCLREKSVKMMGQGGVGEWQNMFPETHSHSCLISETLLPTGLKPQHGILRERKQ